MAFRRQPDVSGGRARRVEFPPLGQLGRQARRSLRADAGDRIQQLTLSLECRGIIEGVVDLSLDFGDPLMERLEDLLPRLADSLGQAAFAQPVTDLRALLEQLIEVT